MRKSYHDPEFFCTKCNTRLRVSDFGQDFQVEPCGCQFDRGWNECYQFNIGKGGVLWQHIKDRIRNSTPWVVVGYGAGLLFCLACWYAVFVMLAPMF